MNIPEELITTDPEQAWRNLQAFGVSALWVPAADVVRLRAAEERMTAELSRRMADAIDRQILAALEQGAASVTIPNGYGGATRFDLSSPPLTLERLRQARETLDRRAPRLGEVSPYHAHSPMPIEEPPDDTACTWEEWDAKVERFLAEWQAQEQQPY
jgi:hypothetical protein